MDQPEAPLDVGILGKVETLSEQEMVDYQTLETIVSMGWQNFAEVGIALAEIRDRRLYRAEFGTFEEYCRAKWRYHRTYVYRLISAAQLFRHLSTNCRQNPPSHESQLTPLIGLTKEQAQLAWESAAQNADGRRITARIIKSAVRELNLTISAKPIKPSSAATKAQQRQLVLETCRELLPLLHQRADHATLLEKAEALHRHVQAALAVRKRKPGAVA